jgi:predicted transcriptional regulator
MRTTVALDDDLVRIAQELTGVAEMTALIREALKALIERESAWRLASLGGHHAGIEEYSAPKGAAELILAEVRAPRNFCTGIKVPPLPQRTRQGWGTRSGQCAGAIALSEFPGDRRDGNV